MTQKDMIKRTRRYVLAFLSTLCLWVLIVACILQISNRPARAATYDPSLVFGTNVGLYDSSDQVYANQAARTTLQQNNIHMARVPLRTINGSDDDQLLASTVKELVAGGFIPL